MSRRLSTSWLTVVALMSCVSVICQAEALPLLTRHVRAVTLNGQAPSLGRLPGTQTLRIDVVLPLRNPDGLDSFLETLYDSSSPSYRHFLTVSDFTAKFGPSQEDYDALIRFANASGFTVVGGTRDAMDVQLKGSVADIEAAFHVTLRVYRHPTESRTFFAPDREPSVDMPFQLWHISGLDNYSIPRPALLHRTSKLGSKATTGSCPEQSFCGSDMRAAYYGGTAFDGTGQNIGLLEYAGYDIDDVNTYYQNAGQTRTADVTGISTDGTSLSCLASQGCDDTEQTIDITQALGMAPGATTVYVYVGSSDTALLGAMSSDTPLPAQLSSSWLWGPSDPNTDNPYFERMAAQGQNLFQASGDDAKFNAGYPTWPCDAAYVTSVGGTDLETTGPGAGWRSEIAWSASGGGYWAPDGIPIPSWQKAMAKGCTYCSQIYRNAPDVSANANYTFYVCADQTTCSANVIGGTSFAAPMWAGYLALINQKRAAQSLPPAGFINPSIYKAGLSKAYDNYFHDIMGGTNGYPTGPGFDLATGWGSPKSDSPIFGGDQ
jgi:subtilase family serine protease